MQLGRCAALGRAVVVGLAELPGPSCPGLSSADDIATMATPMAVPPCLPSFWISLGRLVALEVLPATIYYLSFIFGWLICFVRCKLGTLCTQLMLISETTQDGP